MPINHESNTWKRVEFNRMFGMLSVYSDLKGIPFIVTTYTRTPAEQNKLFKRGLSNCDGYDQNRPSRTTKRLASSGNRSAVSGAVDGI